jgi:hypothetical protein
MAHSSSLHVEDCIVCDDIRVEAGGKETLVGVYTTGISVPAMPWIVNACLWLRAKWSGEGQTWLEFQIIDPRNAQVFSRSGSARPIFQGLRSSLAIKGVVFKAEMEGDHEIQWRPMGDAQWQSIDRIPIMIARAAPRAA